MEPPKQAVKGFTLIEILVVMVIISIVAGVAMLTISSNTNRQLENLSHAMVNLLQLAEEEASLRPAVIGITIGPTQLKSYELLETSVFNQAVWSLITNSPLQLRSYPRHTALRLIMQGKTIPLKQTPEPQIIISTSGDITPFTLLIGKQGGKPQYRLVGKNNGTIYVEPFNNEE